MQDLYQNIDKTNLPKHVAIIMDGNGRWAKNQGLARIEGHRRGAKVVEDITEAAREIGVKYLTLYAFSKENWNRPTDETTALMILLHDFLVGKKQKLLDNGIRLNAIGDLRQLPEPVRETLNLTIEDTSVGREMVLTLALSYGARDEIIRCVKKIGELIADHAITTDHIDEKMIAAHLDTSTIPDPDLIIRTSGESRISNFLLWQAAYAELNFVKKCWPEFTPECLVQCLVDYQNRERRFGRTSEQLD